MVCVLYVSLFLCIFVFQRSAKSSFCVYKIVRMCVERICSELDVDVPWVLCRLTLPFGFSGANYEGGDGNQLSRDTYGPYPLFIDPLSHCFRVEYSESNLQLCLFAFLSASCTNFFCFSFSSVIGQASSFVSFLGRLSHFSKTNCLCEFLLLVSFSAFKLE